MKKIIAILGATAAIYGSYKLFEFVKSTYYDKNNKSSCLIRLTSVRRVRYLRYMGLNTYINISAYQEAFIIH